MLVQKYLSVVSLLIVFFLFVCFNIEDFTRWCRGALQQRVQSRNNLTKNLKYLEAHEQVFSWDFSVVNLCIFLSNLINN